MKQTFRSPLCWALCAIGVIAATGCSTAPSVAPVAASALQTAQPPIAIDYAEGQQQTLAQLQLQPALEAYWRTHIAKNWQQLFTMEHAKSLPSVEFYAAYHAKAWPVLAVQVVDVEVQDRQATLTLHMRFQNPDKKGREQALYRKDQWMRTDDGRWVHVVTDPMLVGVHH